MLKQNYYWKKTSLTKTGLDIVSRRIARGSFPGVPGEYGNFSVNLKALRHPKGGFTARLEFIGLTGQSTAEAVLAEELPAFRGTQVIIFHGVEDIIKLVQDARRSKELGVPHYAECLSSFEVDSDWHLEAHH